MQVEIFSHPKARDRAEPGDDVVLAIPGLVFAVLDGATDPSGIRYQGQTGGRIAALAAARGLVGLLMQEGDAIEARRIGDILSQSVAAAAAELGATHSPSTTLAAAISTSCGFRLVAIGDSGIRINGTRVLQSEKLIDRISTAFRLRVRHILQTRISDPGKLEAACRRVVAQGLDVAANEAILFPPEVAMVIDELGSAFSTQIANAKEDFLTFLHGGILVQPRFANNPTHPFGFASIIGTPPRGFGIIEEFLSHDEFRSIEVFSDGYFDPPQGTFLRDWEARFAAIEDIDPAKTGPFASVKGSTRKEFADDRTVICLNGA